MHNLDGFTRIAGEELGEEGYEDQLILYHDISFALEAGDIRPYVYLDKAQTNGYILVRKLTVQIMSTN